MSAVAKLQQLPSSQFNSRKNWQVAIMSITWLPGSPAKMEDLHPKA
jgi:hypothetical protein